MKFHFNHFDKKVELHCHLSTRLLNVKDMVDKLHCNVCLLEYRGYGHSDGNPSEDGIYMDAQAALDYLTKTYQRSDIIDPRKVISIYFHESISDSSNHSHIPTIG